MHQFEKHGTSLARMARSLRTAFGGNHQRRRVEAYEVLQAYVSRGPHPIVTRCVEPETAGWGVTMRWSLISQQPSHIFAAEDDSFHWMAALLQLVSNKPSIVETDADVSRTMAEVQAILAKRLVSGTVSALGSWVPAKRNNASRAAPSAVNEAFVKAHLKKITVQALASDRVLERAGLFEEGWRLASTRTYKVP